MSRATGAYVKGDKVRQVATQGEAVQAEWDGFRPAAGQDADAVDYRDLQAQAQALGIPANQKKAELAKAIAEKSVEDAGEQDPQSALGQAPTVDDSGSPESVPEGLGNEPFDPQS